MILGVSPAQHQYFHLRGTRRADSTGDSMRAGTTNSCSKINSSYTISDPLRSELARAEDPNRRFYGAGEYPPACAFACTLGKRPPPFDLLSAVTDVRYFAACCPTMLSEHSPFASAGNGQSRRPLCPGRSPVRRRTA